MFAVNTISMVKNDALFSYVAPSNIVAWILTPMRFCLPFRAFIKLNRTVIKITHFPLLFSIYAYEKLFLATAVFEPTDLVENHGPGRKRVVSFQDGGLGLFSPNIRMRQESVAGFQKDKALDEVFRLAPRGDTLRTLPKTVDRQTRTVVKNWMDHQGERASPPQEQDQSVVERLEMRRQARKASMMRRGMRREISGTRSVASDPAEFMTSGGFYDNAPHFRNVEGNDDLVGQTDADGDDELLTNDEDEVQTLGKGTSTNRSRSRVSGSDKDNESGDEDYFHTPRGIPKQLASSLASKASSRKRFPGHNLDVPKPSPPKRRQHNRTISTTTILYNPLLDPQHQDVSSSASPPKSRPMTSSNKHSKSGTNTGTHTPVGSRTPRHSIYTTANSKPRPIMPNRSQFQSVPNFQTMGGGNAFSQQPSTRTPTTHRQVRHRRSSFDMSEMGIDPGAGMVPSSFATQMALATGGLKGLRGESSRREETEGMMGRLMLARMKTLEEGFAEVVKEFRGLRTAGNSSVEDAGFVAGRIKGKDREITKASRKRREGLMARTKSEVDVGTLGRGNPGKGKDVEVLMGENEAENEAGHSEETEGIVERYLERGSSL